MEQLFQYVEADPAPALSRHVSRYWIVAARGGDAPAYPLQPDGGIAVAWVRAPGARAQALLAGPRLAPWEIPMPAGSDCWGARFRPEAGGAVLGIRAPELRNVVVRAPTSLQGGMDSVPPNPDPGAVAAALDALLLAMVLAAPPLDGAVHQAVEAIGASGGAAKLGVIAAIVGLDDRQLQRRFRLATGLTPGQYAGLCRSNATRAGASASSR